MSTLTGTGALARLAVRRDKLMLPIWIYVLTALVAGTAYSFRKLYPTVAVRFGFATTAGRNPALLSLYGPLHGDSIGALTAWRYGTLAALGAGLMSIFIVVRHTRADEETGRLELVGSAVVGRHAALVAALLVSSGSNVALGALICAGLIALGLPATGSVALAAVIAGTGLVFTAVAAVAAQVAGTARSARGVAIGVVGAAYLLRAVGDSASAQGPRWLTWLSPIGWAEQIRPFGQTDLPASLCSSPLGCVVTTPVRWWVLILPAGTAVVAATVAALLAVGRDYDAGLLPLRPGPARGASWLRSPFALAWRLHRGAVIGWTSGALVYGFIIGSAAKGVGGLLDSASIRHIVVEFGGVKNFTDAYLAAVMSFGGLIAAGYAVSVVLRLRSEETSDRADPLLATSASRTSWGLSHLAIAAGGTSLILVLAGLGAGLGFAARSGSLSELGPLVAAGLVQVPAALATAGVAVALFGLAPKASVAGGWTALGVVVLLLFLGTLLRLSHWVLDVSPFAHVPRLPGGTVGAVPLLWLSVVALALAAAGLAGLRRRDIG
ncbi:MAG TPA: ABC transporter permease [Streptosporangiaceae bacterium]